MARNAEKAMTALARWHKMKIDEERGPVQRRPGNTLECTEVKQAEKWRMQVIREIAKKIAQIQNPGLGEFKIRDVNDEINKLLRIKYHWEVRVKELGGPDYKRIAPKMLDREGKEVPGNRGYKYFGAAKDLPGVRELFEKPVADTSRKTRVELARFIDADYYGYMDDDDGLLLPLEQEEEIKAIAAAVEEWKSKNADSETITHEDLTDLGIYRDTVGVDDDRDEYLTANFPTLPQGPLPANGDHAATEEPRFVAHVAVPSQQEIGQALLRRRKTEMLEKYAGETLAMQSDEAKALLGYDL